MRGVQSGYTLVGLAMLMVVVGIVALTVLPSVLGKLQTRSVYRQAAVLDGLRDTVLGFAMEQCRLPTQDELLQYAPHHGLGGRSAYVLATGPELTTEKALNGMAATTATDLSLTVPVQGGVQQQRDLAFLVFGTGTNRCRDLESSGTEYTARVPGERFQRDGRTHVYDDLVRYVTLEALCNKTGCCR